jgi:hypothetical protein
MQHFGLLAILALIGFVGFAFWRSRTVRPTEGAIDTSVGGSGDSHGGGDA